MKKKEKKLQSIKLKKNIKIFLGVLFVFLIGASFYINSIPQNKRSGFFSRGTRGLPNVDTAEIVYLRDGDTYDLEASYVTKEIGNNKIRMVAYNGSVPGPFIHIEQGAEITINFINNLDLEGTIHHHGLRLDFPFDGTPGVSQEEVAPGEVFTYKLKFPDAGTYWYHPHVREDYAMDLGLYGNYRVEPKEYEYSPVNRELGLIIDDILIKDGEVVPHFRDKTNFALMGRFGNIMLVNGDTDFELDVDAGEVVRLHFTNVANVRPFELTIPKARMKLVGSDISPYEREEFIEKLLITPSERYIVDVYFPEEGAYSLVHTSHDSALGERSYTLAKFNARGKVVAEDFSRQFLTLKSYPNVTNEVAPLREYLYKSPDRKLRLSLDAGEVDLGSAMENMPCHKMPDGTWMGECTPETKEEWLAGLSADEMALGGETIHWEDHMYVLNEQITNEDIKWELIDEDTGKVSEEINDWKFRLGDLVKVRIFNDPMSAHPMQHPIHFHGQRFVVLSRNGVPETNMVWKDTTLAKVGETVDILVEMSNPGVWMTHCHISEHMHAGMMFNFAVGEDYWNHPAMMSGHEM